MREHSGFTLVELMVVICVIGVLSAVAYPNLTAWYSRKGTWVATRELQHVVGKAQMSAIRNGANTILSVRDDSPTYYTLSLDANLDGIGEQVLQTGILPAKVSLYEASGDGKVVFNARGMGQASRTFLLKNDSSKHPFFTRLTVNVAGRVRVARSGTGADGSWEDVR